MDDPVPQLVAGLRASRNYRNVCDATLERVARWSLQRYPQPKHALKMAKNKLHQIYGAYMDTMNAEQIENRLASATDVSSLRSIGRDVLGSHASTRERMPLLESLYGALFDITGMPESILDLACGLHPFALPWMGIPPSTRYIPIDIDFRLAQLHNVLLSAVGMQPLARCEDLLAADRFESTQMVFLLKALPCLDQQDHDASNQVLSKLQAPWLVVSFPTRSLGGRAKGMQAHYAAQYQPLLQRHGHLAATLTFPNETFYVLSKR